MEQETMEKLPVREELRSKEHIKSVNNFVMTFKRKPFSVILFQTREMA